jgi:hypothetical protein
MRTSLLVLALVAGSAFADSRHAAPLDGALHRPLPASASLYSFADLHRLAVAGIAPAQSAAAGGGAPDSPLRLATAQAPAAAEPLFSVRPVAPHPALLLLSGLALAGWVAHRRLAQAL